MHIGLIGGIGPAATDLYYRGLIDAMKARGHVLDATIVHADAPTLVRNFEARQPEAQAEIFLRLADRLVGAGAKALAITSISMGEPVKCIMPTRFWPCASLRPSWLSMTSSFSSRSAADCPSGRRRRPNRAARRR